MHFTLYFPMQQALFVETLHFLGRFAGSGRERRPATAQLIYYITARAKSVQKFVRFVNGILFFQPFSRSAFREYSLPISIRTCYNAGNDIRKITPKEDAP